MKSVEDHFRLKDPQRHKAKLLKVLHNKEEAIGQQQEFEDFSIITAYVFINI